MTLSPRLFGAFLVSAGVLTSQQNEHILNLLAEDKHRRFYEVAVSLGYLKPGDIDAYLDGIRALTEQDRSKRHS